MDGTPARALLPRQTQDPTGSYGTGNEFLSLLSSPFDVKLGWNSVLSAIIFSLVFTAVIVVGFCFIRPYNNVVYAPRAKHADSKHAPPPIDRGLFGWIKTLIKTKEPELVEKLGLDAAVFLRFLRMMRNLFITLTVVGCGIIIPVNMISSPSSALFLIRFTPSFMSNSSLAWAYVVVSYLFDGIIFYFLWYTYRNILRLRRAYFETPEYQHSLHARTLLLTDLPRALRSDEGIVQITERLGSAGAAPRPAVARNVRDLPELVEEHEESVRELEKVLAKYLKNPNKLPAKRPTCKASKNDKAFKSGQQVDAIEYLTHRIKELEGQVKEVRLSVDQRNPMSYGFASYDSIPAAHTAAYAARKGTPEKAIVRLAPKPQDLIWKNLAMMKKQRDWQNFINNLWVALLTVAWIAPNILIAVFLSNLAHLGLVWPSFQRTLYAHPTFWALVQGIASPAITTAFYYFLPAIMRKLVTRAGDVTRTGRERHVLDKLFSFFIFNNLVVFSLFSAIWGFVAAVIQDSNTNGQNAWDAIKNNNPFDRIILALITVTPYWCSWLLQRNLGAAIDLGQLVSLTWGSISRRFLSPTPRELIELTAPQPFQYAAYYNYFIFYAAVALCFGLLQPLALAITALYFSLDSFAKKYMIMYIFITKYESGGMFWKALFDRMLIATGLGNVVIACLVATKGSNWIAMLASMVPLLGLIGLFKWYCMRQFDDKIQYYSKGTGVAEEGLMSSGDRKRRGGDRAGVRFGHPALFKPLMTPMVSAKSQHMLKQVYSGRTSMDESGRVAGFSDVYMENMDSSKPGRAADPTAPFEVVSDNQLDYEYWKDKPEFRDEAGGNGELFGRPPDMSRPGTPSTLYSGHNRMSTLDSTPYHSRDPSRDVYGHTRTDSDSEYAHVYNEDVGMEYPQGYHQAPNIREQSPVGARAESRERLVASAARMGMSPPPPPRVSRVAVGSRPGSAYGQIRSAGPETPYYSTDEETSYDYFRRGRM
ncbi:hypothetical protein BDY17DRAFT_320437 [Neohortaea acidophila]|uniref:DUF221-domain-containing protein n=1 Tax=Neohortaea acidophila TaxID=245834 RepID=A0A6A6Q962_9PEZI|nr:uncharacterized protein BDY17DRAFT_320437 [Neohortaea acidophila]KAF2487927.1 hypothetical protein BDY17DRAFT_320437 [Neohortaea acidophila]